MLTAGQLVFLPLKMLGAIQQMLEKTHNAVNTLRDRLAVVELAIQQTRTEQERKEVIFPFSMLS